MAQTKKQPKRSVTMWFDGSLVAWLEERVHAREAATRTQAATEALEMVRSFRARLGDEWWLELRRRAVTEDGGDGETLGATAAMLVGEALEKRGRR